MMTNRVFWTLFISGLLLIACQRGVVYTHTEPIPESGWKAGDFKKFELVVTDTLNQHSIDLTVRHDGRYEYSNLFLFILTTAPTGETIKDTIECTLADRRGKWLGRGLGGRYQFTVPYKRQVVFPYKGTYSIEVEQGMREDPLPYISDIGMLVKVDK